MELVTPRANVTWVGLHEPPGEPALGPEVGLEHALYR
jgi:hypothetical protein